MEYKRRKRNTPLHFLLLGVRVGRYSCDVWCWVKGSADGANGKAVQVEGWVWWWLCVEMKVSDWIANVCMDKMKLWLKLWCLINAECCWCWVGFERLGLLWARLAPVTLGSGCRCVSAQQVGTAPLKLVWDATASWLISKCCTPNLVVVSGGAVVMRVSMRRSLIGGWLVADWWLDCKQFARWKCRVYVYTRMAQGRQMDSSEVWGSDMLLLGRLVLSIRKDLVWIDSSSN